MAVPPAVGAYLDSRFGWSPWGVIVGAGLGLTVGLIHLVALANSPTRSLALPTNGNHRDSGAPPHRWCAPVLVLAAVPVKYLGGGDATWAHSGTALLLCLVPGVITLLWASRTEKRMPPGQLTMLLGATSVRLFGVLPGLPCTFTLTSRSTEGRTAS